MDGDLNIAYDANGDLIYDRPSPAAPAAPVGGHFGNLANMMDQNDLDQICTMLSEHIANDEAGRSAWEDLCKEAIELLGVGPESEPSDGDDADMSDTSDHPLLLTALTRFQSKASIALLPSDDEMVNYKPAFNPEAIKDPNQRRLMLQDAHEAGRRVQRFYTDYLKNKLTCYVDETELLLSEMGLQGLGVRKVYTDMSRAGAPVQACYIPAENIIVSYDAKNFRSGRITQRMDMPTPDLIRMITSGQYRPVENLSDTSDHSKDPIEEAKDRIVGLSNSYMQGTETHRIYEVHCELFLESDGHPKGMSRPYIVTIHSQSMEVLSIVRNWRPNDPDERRIEHFTGYLFHPGKTAIYGMGLGHILANVTRALRKAQRRGLEAAYLQNHPSGFKLSSFKIRDDATKIRSGEFQDVDSPSGDIRSAIMVQPFEGPSPGLLQLADKLESNGKQLGLLATQDMENLLKAGMAAGPAMAAVEENTEFQSAIHARLYRGHASELKDMHRRMREVYGQNPVPFGENEMLEAGDLLKVNILPKMKPGQSSKQKAVLEAQAVIDLASSLPDIINKREAGLDFLRAIGKPNIDDLMMPDPSENPPQPADPATEYAQVMQGMPIRAGMHQNHMSHVDAHTAQMQGIQTSQLPVEQGEQIMAVMASHIAEHYAQDMLAKTASAMGIPVEQFGENMPPEIEAQLAPQMAQAIQQIEADRAPDEAQQESKAQIEAIKGRIDIEKETMKQRHDREMQELKHAQNMEMQRQRDDAAMERAEQDDETAIQIAEMGDEANSAPNRAGIVSK